jgi:hypothetical protein
MEVDMSNVGTRGSRGGAPEPYRRFLGFICWETGRDKNNLLRFAGLFLLWTVTHEGISFIQTNVEMSTTLAWMLAVVPALPGVLAVLAYFKFLREADEMVRRIHLTGMAVGFGAGIFVWMGLQMPLPPGTSDKEMLFTLHLHKALIFLAMIVGWVAGQSIATRRYK